MDILKMQAAAHQAIQDRNTACRAYHKGFPYASKDAEAAALDAFASVSRRAAFGRVQCECVVPENRTTYRRRHNRFIWWVDGKRASIEQAAAALGAVRLAA